MSDTLKTNIYLDLIERCHKNIDSIANKISIISQNDETTSKPTSNPIITNLEGAFVGLAERLEIINDKIII